MPRSPFGLTVSTATEVTFMFLIFWMSLQPVRHKAMAETAMRITLFNRFFTIIPNYIQAKITIFT